MGDTDNGDTKVFARDEGDTKVFDSDNSDTKVFDPHGKDIEANQSRRGILKTLVGGSALAGGAKLVWDSAQENSVNAINPQILPDKSKTSGSDTPEISSGAKQINSPLLARKPSFERGADLGFYVWHDGTRITVTSNGEARGGHRVHEFDIRASNGEFLAIETTNWNSLDIFKIKTPTRLHGKAYVKNGADTFSFATTAAKISFNFQISDRITGSPTRAEELEYRETLPTKARPNLVYLGKEEKNPKNLPFTISVS